MLLGASNNMVLPAEEEKMLCERVVAGERKASVEEFAALNQRQKGKARKISNPRVFSVRVCGDDNWKVLMGSRDVSNPIFTVKPGVFKEVNSSPKPNRADYLPKPNYTKGTALLQHELEHKICPMLNRTLPDNLLHVLISTPL